MALTPEELKQIEDFAAEDEAAEQARQDAAMRQHIAAQVLRRRIAKEKGLVHGEDFAVLEFNRGGVNVVLRTPTEQEAELLNPESMTAEHAEAFCSAIVLQPEGVEWLKFKVKYTGAEAAVITAAGELCAAVRTIQAKK